MTEIPDGWPPLPPNSPRWLHDAYLSTIEYIHATSTALLTPQNNSGFQSCGHIADHAEIDSVDVIDTTAKRDIVDEIDRLVDEQLAGGEPRNGYDYGNPDYPRCPHCNRHWHGLPITEQISVMYEIGVYDESYSAANDDSQILCEGAEFIGPQRAPIPLGWFPWPRLGLIYREVFADSPPAVWVDSRRWWRLGHSPEEFEVQTNLGEIGHRLRIGNSSPVQIFDYRWHGSQLDILAESTATEHGGTWEPLTATGVIEHPELPRQPALNEAGQR